MYHFQLQFQFYITIPQFSYVKGNMNTSLQTTIDINRESKNTQTDQFLPNINRLLEFLH